MPKVKTGLEQIQFVENFKFSRRADFIQEKNPQTELQEILTLRGDELLDLTVSNPTKCGFIYPEEELKAALISDISHYHPDPLGLMEAREAVAKYYESRGVSISPDEILLTSSTSEAYSYLFKLLSDPGDEILIPQPSYPLFDYLGQMESIRNVHYPMFYSEGWHIDFEAVLQKITPRTRALLLVNPNNPTGNFVSRREWKRLLEICTRHRIALICDEVFFDYPVSIEDREIDPMESDCGLCFFLNGLSKTAGLPQLKLSWIIVKGNSRLQRRSLEKLEWISDTYLSVNTPVQIGLEKILGLSLLIQEQILKRIRENYRHLLEFLKGTSITPFEVQGGWSAVLKLPSVQSEQDWILEFLKNGRFMVHPGHFFGFPSEAYVVVSLLVPPGPLKAGVNRMIEIVEKH